MGDRRKEEAEENETSSQERLEREAASEEEREAEGGDREPEEARGGFRGGEEGEAPVVLAARCLAGRVHDSGEEVAEEEGERSKEAVEEAGQAELAQREDERLRWPGGELAQPQEVAQAPEERRQALDDGDPGEVGPAEPGLPEPEGARHMEG